MPVITDAPGVVNQSGVQLIHWPRDRAARVRAALALQPRLLLLQRGEAPPLTTDPLEDWSDAAAPIADIAARIDRLQRRSELGPTPHANHVPTLSPSATAALELLLFPAPRPIHREQLSAGAVAQLRAAIAESPYELVSLTGGDIALMRRFIARSQQSNRGETPRP